MESKHTEDWEPVLYKWWLHVCSPIIYCLWASVMHFQCLSFMQFSIGPRNNKSKCAFLASGSDPTVPRLKESKLWRRFLVSTCRLMVVLRPLAEKIVCRIKKWQQICLLYDIAVSGARCCRLRALFPPNCQTSLSLLGRLHCSCLSHSFLHIHVCVYDWSLLDHFLGMGATALSCVHIRVLSQVIIKIAHTKSMCRHMNMYVYTYIIM